MSLSVFSFILSTDFAALAVLNRGMEIHGHKHHLNSKTETV